MFRRQPTVLVVPSRERTEYVTREVREHRAPTDESVKLLKEFEDAADKRRIETLHLENNAFKGTVFVQHRSYSADVVARCVFDLNGHRISVDADLPLTAQPQHEAQNELLKLLRDRLAERIASEVLIELASRTLAEWPRQLVGSVRSTSGLTAESGDALNQSPRERK